MSSVILHFQFILTCSLFISKQTYSKVSTASSSSDKDVTADEGDKGDGGDGGDGANVSCTGTKIIIK